MKPTITLLIPSVRGVAPSRKIQRALLSEFSYISFEFVNDATATRPFIRSYCRNGFNLGSNCDNRELPMVGICVGVHQFANRIFRTLEREQRTV